MIFRVLAVIVLVALAYWAFPRIVPYLSRDRRLWGMLAGMGLMALRGWLSRGGLGGLMRLLRFLRFLR